MATRLGYYTTYSGSTQSGTMWQTYPYVALSETKTASARRVSPVGVNKLFSGTFVSSSKVTRYQGVAHRFFFGVNSPNSSWTGEAVPIAGVGTPSFGLQASLSSAANNLRKKIQTIDVNLAQAFAERKQTADMFVDFGGRILRAARGLRAGSPRSVYSALTGGNHLPNNWKSEYRKRVKVPKHVFDAASDSWLAWQYGVRPLIQDLKGSVAAYHKARGVRPLIRRVSLRTKSEKFAARIFDAPSNTYAESWASLDGRVTAYVEMQVGADLWSTADQLGLTNPALLAWELIPYSFVFDWFINVGDYLQAAQSIRGLVRSGVHLTSTYKHDMVRSSYGGQSWQKEVVKTREFQASLPGPTISVSSSPFNTDKSLDRVLSAVALARAPLRGVSLPSYHR